MALEKYKKPLMKCLLKLKEGRAIGDFGGLMDSIAVLEEDYRTICDAERSLWGSVRCLHGLTTSEVECNMEASNHRVEPPGVRDLAIESERRALHQARMLFFNLSDTSTLQINLSKKLDELDALFDKMGVLEAVGADCLKVCITEG